MPRNTEMADIGSRLSGKQGGCTFGVILRHTGKLLAVVSLKLSGKLPSGVPVGLPRKPFILALRTSPGKLFMWVKT